MRIGITIPGGIALLFSTLAFGQAPDAPYSGSWRHFDDVYKRLTLSRNARPWLPVNPRVSLHVIGDDLGETSIEGQAFNADFVWLGSRANGDADKPKPLKKNDYITTWASAGSDGLPIVRPDGTKVYQKQGAAISHRTCSNWTEQNHCTDIRFYPRRATDHHGDIFEAVKIGGEEGDTLTVNGTLHAKDRLTATAIKEPGTPPRGKAYIYLDKATKKLCVKNDRGRSRCL